MDTNEARLESCIQTEDWETLLSILKPKFFPRAENGELVSPLIVARISDALTNSPRNVPMRVKIMLIKCLMNSCVNGYTPKEYDAHTLTPMESEDFYAVLGRNYAKVFIGDSTDEHGYPFLNHFPYDGVAKWAADYVVQHLLDVRKLSDDELELLRLCVQFLCNLCKYSPPAIHDERFKEATMMLIRHDHFPVLRAACAFIHNILTVSEENYYSETAKNELTILLIKPVKLGISSATDALKYLLENPGRLQNIYEKILIEDRLYLLEFLLQELRNSELNLSREVISFLSERFKKKSDLVLKTVNSYLDGTEPMEITILLDILGVVTSRTSSSNYSNNLQEDKSLLINCIFLLKSLHMVGREYDNFFTPVQKLSELAPSGENSSGHKTNDIQSHPAFGFKAGLIRVIGNMVHKHKANQELLRETDGIPLLLDCCNMDARNPLIMQWTILAMRNVCENNQSNQDVVRGLNKIGVADSAVLHEMGLILHDEGKPGKAVGIVPLKRN